MRSRNTSNSVVVGGEHGEHARLRLVADVAHELGDAELLDDLSIPVESGVVGLVALARRLGALTLGRHLALEAGQVDIDRTLAGDLLRQLEWESVGVVQQEGRGAREAGARRELVVEDHEPGLQRVAEALLLTGEHADDEVAVLDHVGIGVAHHVDRSLDQAWHHELIGAEQVGVAHGASQDPAQHVAASFVRREHTVADQHRRRPGVLGEHAQGEAVAIVVVADAIRLAGHRLGGLDQRQHEVGLPHRVDALQQRQDPLEPGPRVDRRLGQCRARAVGRLVELHEHQVPELHEAIALRVVERAAVGPERRAAIDVDLGARPARAGVAHLPEIVLVAESLDPLHRHADLLVPDLLGLVVVLVNGDPEAVAVEAPTAAGGIGGDEVPAPRDDLALEVVAEAEVAHHLEEHEVTLGAPDVVEIVVLAAGAGALL